MSDLDNKLIMLEDLVDELKGSYVRQLIKRKDMSKTFVDKPEVCPHCQSGKISGIEVMGAQDDILLWECTKCLCIYLRYDKSFTEKELEVASIFWTNSKDWGYRPKSQYN